MDLFSFHIVDDKKEYVAALALCLGERRSTADCAFTGRHEDALKNQNKRFAY